MNKDMALNTVSIQRTINVGGTSTPFLQESSNRISVIINAPPSTGGPFTLSLAETAVPDQGITLFPSNDPLLLTLAQYGQLVTLSWTAISNSGAAQDITVIETFVRS